MATQEQIDATLAMMAAEHPKYLVPLGKYCGVPLDLFSKEQLCVLAQDLMIIGAVRAWIPVEDLPTKKEEDNASQ